MILEIADIRIQPGRRPSSRPRSSAASRRSSPGPRAFALSSVRKGIESPERYMLMIEWETLEDHTEEFRGGPLFPEWRAIVGPFFAAPPAVEHYTLLAQR